ncbi:MAG: hypothetical protein WC227_03960 [Patescibacteria group bacterium]
MLGIDEGIYPKIGRIIPPGFGLPWSDDGALINPDPVVRQIHHDVMVHAFKESAHVRESGHGLGNVIYWTGPDGIRWQRLVNGVDSTLSYEDNPNLEEWRMIVEGLTNAVGEARGLGYTNEKLLIEAKEGGDPCYLDPFTDVSLQILAISQINEGVGAKVAEWQGEFCHTRGGGTTFANGMTQAIGGGVFGGRIHLNSGPIANQRFSTMLAKGTPLSKFQQYVDPDYLPGQGVEEWLDDQQKSIQIGAEWSAQTGQPFEIEFDARFSRYPDMMGELRKSTLWTLHELQKHGALPA